MNLKSIIQKVDIENAVQNCAVVFAFTCAAALAVMAFRPFDVRPADVLETVETRLATQPADVLAEVVKLQSEVSLVREEVRRLEARLQLTENGE